MAADMTLALVAFSQPSAGWWIASLVATIFVIALPIALIVAAHRWLKVGWRYAAYGALIFFTFQLITRVPLIQIAQYFVYPKISSSRPAVVAFLLFAALTAGILEEVGRYRGYRGFMGRERKTWAKGGMYGLGHGGLESAVLVGGLSVIPVINVWLLSSTNLGIVPAAQRAHAAQQLASIATQPGWLPLLGGWERICAITAHVMFSLIVLQVFRRGSLSWLWLAIGLHTLLDAVSALLPEFVHLGTIGNDLLIEGFVGVFALASLSVIIALRRRSADDDLPDASPPPASAAALRADRTDAA